MENGKGTFNYTYSAKQQEEIQNIRKKYLPRQENKMEQLRRLDQSATKKGTVVSILMGVVGCLLFIPGVIIGVIGIVAIAAAYPLYSRITKKQRQKLAPQILKLTEELSKPE